MTFDTPRADGLASLGRTRSANEGDGAVHRRIGSAVTMAMLALALIPATASAVVTLNRAIDQTGTHTHTYTFVTDTSATLTATGTAGNVAIPTQPTVAGTVSYTFTATSPITLTGVTTGCTGAGTTAVTCPTGAGVVNINIIGSSARDALNAGTHGPTSPQAVNVDIDGLAGPDTLTGGPFVTSLDGGADDDVLVGGLGDDGTLVCGIGVDTVSYNDVGRLDGVTANLTTGVSDADGGEVLSGCENLTGSSENDTLTGSAVNNRIEGLGGSDTIDGLDADDTLLPGIGSDGSIDGGPGNDTVSFNDVGRVAGVAAAVNQTGAPVIPGATQAAEDEVHTNIEVLQGTNLADTLSTATPARTINGLGANDLIIGSAGADTLTGDAGNDELRPGAGTDTVGGGLDNDTVSYANLAGPVTVNLTTDTTAGGAGVDTLTSVENAIGSPGNDTLDGDGEVNVLDGLGGADILTGGAQNDVLRPGIGLDTTIDCGSGAGDQVSYDDPGRTDPVTLDLDAGADPGADGGENPQGCENAIGGGGADVISGTAEANNLRGGPGTAGDTLTGEGGDDVLDGMEGPDTLDGNDGNDMLFGGAGDDAALRGGTGNDQLTGGDGGDRLEGGDDADTLDAGGGDDTVIPGGGDDGAVNGGDGIDTVRYDEAGRSGGVTVDLTATDVPDGGASDGLESLSGFENVVGSGADDIITGDGGANALTGGDGNDTLRGLGGADTLTGGSGNDTLEGGDDGDALQGESGNDTLDGGGANDTLQGGEGDDVLRGAAGADGLDGGEGNDDLDGGSEGDVLAGGGGTDLARYDGRTGAVSLSIDGQANDGEAGEGDNVGADIENLLGGGGADTLIGSAGANTLDGGGGNDSIDGQGGSDVLRGGDGDDLVSARDGVGDSVDCGGGADEAVLDDADTIAGCERTNRSQVVEDKDADGIGVPLDCNDTNPAIRPGALEIPGNDVDENCDNLKAPFPLTGAGISSGFVVNRDGSTTLTQFQVNRAPAGSRVIVTCRNAADKKIKKKSRRSCPYGTRTRAISRATAIVDLLSPFKRRKLRGGTRILLRLSVPQQIGKSLTFTTRNRKRPTRVVGCVAAGGTASVTCPAS